MRLKFALVFGVFFSVAAMAATPPAIECYSRIAPFADPKGDLSFQHDFNSQKITFAVRGREFVPRVDASEVNNLSTQLANAMKNNGMISNLLERARAGGKIRRLGGDPLTAEDMRVLSELDTILKGCWSAYAHDPATQSQIKAANDSLNATDPQPHDPVLAPEKDPVRAISPIW